MTSPSTIISSLATLLHSNSQKLGLAVLHPRKLVVFEVVGAAGEKRASGAEARYFQLVQKYEHKLQRTAYNFCYGPFGGNSGDKSKDSLCVQSMDGQLYILEQEMFAFARFLNDFLIPGAAFSLERHCEPSF